MAQRIKTLNIMSIVMVEITNKDLASRLDLIQNSVWSIEEIIMKNFGSIAKQFKDIEGIESALDLINEKLKKLDKEFMGLRNNNHA